MWTIGDNQFLHNTIPLQLISSDNSACQREGLAGRVHENESVLRKDRTHLLLFGVIFFFPRPCPHLEIGAEFSSPPNRAALIPRGPNPRNQGALGAMLASRFCVIPSRAKRLPEASAAAGDTSQKLHQRFFWNPPRRPAKAASYSPRRLFFPFVPNMPNIPSRFSFLS